MTLPANKQKKRGGKRSTSWGKGISGNPQGAPKRGESWAEIIKKIGDMEVEAVVSMIAGWMPTLKKAPKGITLKELVITRAYVGLANEPSASLMNVLMDRAEGKVADKLENTGELKVIVEYGNQNTTAGPTPSSDQDQE